MNAPAPEIGSKAGTHRGIVRWAGQMIGAWIIFGAILFLSAGRLDWTMGWAYLGLNALTQVLSALVLIPRRADMLTERTRVGTGTKEWDRFFAPAIVIAGTNTAHQASSGAGKYGLLWSLEPAHGPRTRHALTRDECRNIGLVLAQNPAGLS